jgi:hypothetical protein
MRGVNSVKLISDQQAKGTSIFKNTEGELLRTNAAIWFNKICKIDHLIPKYIHSKVGANNQQSKNAELAATKYRLRQEIKFLYKKKQVLNE